jgi:hypothetical protein
MKVLHLLLAAVFMLGAVLVSANQTTAAPPTPTVAEEKVITTNGSNKWPIATIGGGRVAVAWSRNDDARFADARDTGGDFLNSTLGSVGNNSTYFNSSVATGSDGSMHYAFIRDGSSIRYRRLNPTTQPGQGINFSGERIVASGQDFANGLDIAVKGANEVFVTWRLNDGGIAFAYSPDRGENWTIIKRVSTPTASYAGRPRISANAAGPVLLTWAGDNGSIYVGAWNGDNFPNTCITCVRYGSPNAFFNPDIVVSPSGNGYVTFYNAGGGVFYGTRQNDGSFGLSRISGDGGVPPGGVAIGADAQDNLHVAWISQAAGDGNFNVYVSVKRANEGEFSAPIVVSRDGSAYKANVEVVAQSKPGYSLTHVVWESFAGGQYIRYARVQSNGIGCLAGLAPEESEANADTVSPQGNSLSRRIYFPLIFKQQAPANCQ